MSFDSPKFPAKTGEPEDPAWIPCSYCEDHWCNIHGMHAFECPCQDLSRWREWKIDPYETPMEDYLVDLND